MKSFGGNLVDIIAAEPSSFEEKSPPLGVNTLKEPISIIFCATQPFEGSAVPNDAVLSEEAENGTRVGEIEKDDTMPHVATRANFLTKERKKPFEEFEVPSWIVLNIFPPSKSGINFME